MTVAELKRKLRNSPFASLQVRITGVKDGSGITAGNIVAGAPGVQGPRNGVGRGLDNGLGKHLGNGHWKDKAAGQAP